MGARPLLPKPPSGSRAGSSGAGSLAKGTRDAWFVYVVRCADDTLYTGVARDVKARIAQHDAGKGARYTRGRGPLKVLATIACAGHGDALRLEARVKKLPRDEKVAFVRGLRATKRKGGDAKKRGAKTTSNS